jgi:nucleotide-binding universal stress UspA family protein
MNYPLCRPLTDLNNKQEGQRMYRRILIALKGNGADHALLDHIRGLAAQTGAQITLLRVIGIADAGGGGLGKQFQLEVGSSGWQRQNEAETYLSQREGQLRQAGLAVETKLVIGTRSEGEEIVSYAAEGAFDLIAMPSDSRPWYKRLLRSAQDDDVLRKATVPTLFVGDGTRQAPVTRTAPRANVVMAILGNAEL